MAVTYDYRAEHGDLLFQKVRDEPKGFRQRRPDGKGGWMGSGLASERVCQGSDLSPFQRPK